MPLWVLLLLVYLVGSFFPVSRILAKLKGA